MRYIPKMTIKKEFDKMKDVILSCTTKDQLTSAKKYHDLWYEKYNAYTHVYKNPTFIFMDAQAIGIFQGMLKFMK